MLAIRMQRTGRKGYASFRVIVQDSRSAPTSGRVVAKLGHHNPHTKETVIDAEAAERYLSNGAQPTPRVVKLFKESKVTLPDWVSEPDVSRKKTVKNPEKLRKNQPASAEAPAEESKVEESKVEESATTDDAPEANAVVVAETTESIEEPAPADDAPVAETQAEAVPEKATDKPEEPAAETEAATEEAHADEKPGAEEKTEEAAK